MALLHGGRRPSWSDVLLSFSPAWFTVCMGTGAMQQLLFNFPYPSTQSPQWMRNLGFCFWVLDVVLFGIFTVVLVARYMSYPKLMYKSISEFPTCSFLGAIPIAFDTIVEGVISYYGKHDSGKWAAFALFWVAVAMTITVSFGLLLYQMISSRRRRIEDVAGLWLMTAAPVVIVAALGSNMSTQFSEKVNVTVMLVSFLLWTCGLMLVHLVMMCYFWRLVAYGLPSEQLLPSSFLPMAPLSQGASGGLQLSIAFSTYLQSSDFTLTQSTPVQFPAVAVIAVAESVHWAGVLAALALLAYATFWLIEASLAMSYKRPRSFSIGMWSLTFPYASYTSAWALLAKDLRNHGMAGFAAANTVIASLVWLFCAGMTIRNTVFTGQLFIFVAAADGEASLQRRNGVESKRDTEQKETHLMDEMNGNAGGSRTPTQSEHGSGFKLDE
ncbi:hypothetical protein NA57DRAFT_73007 [Rhizodiscina lignyota]|uniref:C4-dicarboxylate transporter/malic acid transport protein n=1 Tax=Rhizodiscina lignyota TaxID=1504668 RepID=A0A9P4IKC6_9PEZI|nr:hypothetical protein NA57DRAFT_73007 [Rhizodiscina lignyota]